MPLCMYYFLVILVILFLLTSALVIYDVRVKDYENLRELLFLLIVFAFVISVIVAGRGMDKEIYSAKDYDTAKIAADYKAETQVYSYLYKVFVYDVEIGDVVHITKLDGSDQWIYIVAKDKEQPNKEPLNMEEYKL